MRGQPIIEALGPVVIDRPVTIRVQMLSETGEAYPYEAEDGDWERLEVSVVLASGQCDFPGSDPGKGTVRGVMQIFRTGRCIAFETVAIPREETSEGLVTVVAMFDHKAHVSGPAERSFWVEESLGDPDEEANGDL